MAEIDILVDVGLVPIDQLVPVTPGAVQQGAELFDVRRTSRFDKGLSPCGMGAAEQLLGLLRRRAQPTQGNADGFTPAQAAETRLHEADQPLQRLTWSGIGAGDRWAG